jgi:hypothetical protein
LWKLLIVAPLPPTGPWETSKLSFLKKNTPAPQEERGRGDFIKMIKIKLIAILLSQK